MFTLLLLIILRILPFTVTYFICRIGFSFFLLFSKSPRQQLQKAKLELGENRFPSSLYVKRLSFNVAVMIKLGSALTRRLASNAVLRGEEYLKSIREGRSTAVVGTFHYGPWELIAEVLTLRKYPVAALVTRRGGRLLDRFFVATRRKAGLQTVHDFKQALELTRQGFLLASLFDRTIRGKSDRMNLPYSDYRTSKLPLILAARIRCPILPMMIRFRSRKLELTIGKPTRDIEELRGFFTPFFEQTPYNWLVWGD